MAAIFFFLKKKSFIKNKRIDKEKKKYIYIAERVKAHLNLTLSIL